MKLEIDLELFYDLLALCLISFKWNFRFYVRMLEKGIKLCMCKCDEGDKVLLLTSSRTMPNWKWLKDIVMHSNETLFDCLISFSFDIETDLIRFWGWN